MKGSPHFKFRLYVAGDSVNAGTSLANLKAFCATHLPGHHRIEVVDVFEEPERALAEGVFMTPTLVKFEPLPLARIVGTLSRQEPIVAALGLTRRLAGEADDSGARPPRTHVHRRAVASR